MAKQITFRDLYKEEAAKPTALQVFIAEVAKITRKSEQTVKQWAHGFQSPDELAKHVIAQHFDCDPEHLFPNTQKK